MGVRRFIKKLRVRLLMRKDVVVRHGLAIPTRRSGMFWRILLQIADNQYEEPELDGIARTVRPGDRVLELGAGLGIISAIAARTAGPTGRVRSYEANPALIEDTLAFLAANAIRTVDLVNAVLVPEADPAPRNLHLERSFAQSSLLGPMGQDTHGSVRVTAHSLADVLSEFRPDVLICDIEGAEAELLVALPASTLRAAVVELHPDRLSPAQLQAIDDAMAAQGLLRQEPGPGGTVALYARSGTE